MRMRLQHQQRLLSVPQPSLLRRPRTRTLWLWMRSDYLPHLLQHGTILQASATILWYVPPLSLAGTPTHNKFITGCVCEVTDDLCAQTFGSGYKKNQDSSVCGCVSGGGGITTGQIVGIVVGSVAGALLLLLLALLLAGLLVWLILSGKIPGIYGVRVDQAEFTTANQSPLYQDVWSTHNPVAE